ncbi:hypothetical protein IV203_004606 [Nitzschia inconspicua]|uniref:Uncharacterized protein n=1 Tax=Nitzschia inconspicua TaxID=303405 RepID=A0A9K3L440_9STRA|nr:hypothetical protein IV203_004606 [Nitzschia inconspicua]
MERLGSSMDKDSSFVETLVIPDGSSVRDQAVATVTMPEFEPACVMEDFELDEEVVSQLRMHITTVANLY